MLDGNFVAKVAVHVLRIPLVHLSIFSRCLLKSLVAFLFFLFDFIFIFLSGSLEVY